MPYLRRTTYDTTSMVTPKHPVRSRRDASGGDSSRPPYLLLAVKILLVLLILLLLPRLVATRRPQHSRAKNRRDVNRRYVDLRTNCEFHADKCGGVWAGGKDFLPPEESTPCVTQCLSPACHERIYGDDPLDLGEVDRVRFADFELCAKRELKEITRLDRMEARRRLSDKK